MRDSGEGTTTHVFRWTQLLVPMWWNLKLRLGFHEEIPTGAWMSCTPNGDTTWKLSKLEGAVIEFQRYAVEVWLMQLGKFTS